MAAIRSGAKTRPQLVYITPRFNFVHATGKFRDYHYANFLSGNDPDVRLDTLWYHDHRSDFIAPNVYVWLSGVYLPTDYQNTGDETTG